MRAVTLEQLIAEARSREVSALAELPAELSLSFQQIFDAARVSAPPSGWSVERLQQLLRTDAYRRLDRTSAQSVLASTIAAQGGQVEDVIRDAVARDGAIDAFEKYAWSKLEERIAARKRRIEELDGKARELRAESARLREESKQDRARWREWMARKIAFENELSRAVGYLLDDPVVSISAPPPADQPADAGGEKT
jgi:hypothetical protein